MAKGQKKSNKEIRKPKKDKPAAAAAPAAGLSIKGMSTGASSAKPKK